MTTDITELAQREKFEAWFEGAEALPWGYLKNRRTSDSAYQDPDITDMWVAWKAAGAELVEALEKAQLYIKELRDWNAGLAQESFERQQRISELLEGKVGNALLERENHHVEVVGKLLDRISELESRTVTAAAADVLAERQRQVTAEGWTAERDDGYQNSELADAAACYAIHAHNQGFSTPAHWPWSQDWWKQTSPRRDLVKAGALILAEIERLDRAAGIKVEAE